jgi:tripartite-type tricarboxylate transporter receptor subunit TctC
MASGARHLTTSRVAAIRQNGFGGRPANTVKAAKALEKERRMINRRGLFAIPLYAIPWLSAGTARAQGTFPNRPIKMVVPVAVAGAADFVGRVMAGMMSQQFGRPVVVENFPGAGSTVGATVFLRTPADGYSIFIATNNHALMKITYPEFRYDPVTDFLPLALVARQPFLLTVNPNLPVHSVAELLAWIRQQGGKAHFGASQPGATNYLAGQLLRKITKTDFAIVPYRGAAAASQDLVAGRLDFTIDSPTVLLPLIRAGLLRALAVSTADTSTLLPELPSIQQGGVDGFDIASWTILFTRVGTPPEVVAVLRDAAARALASPEMHEQLKNIMCETWPDGSPAAADALLKSEVARWTSIGADSHPAPG